MFVRSRIDKPLIFRKGGKAWTLKPHAVTLINDPTVTAKEIKGCYGSRVEVISEEGAYTAPRETRQVPKNVVKSKVEVKPVPKPKKVDEASLDALLEEVNKELGELKVDDKRLDTTKDGGLSKEAPAGNTNDAPTEGKDSESNLVSPNAIGGTKAEAKKEEKKTKPARARRTTSNKAKTKRVSSKKATKKQA